jgi:hypothetical protein
MRIVAVLLFAPLLGGCVVGTVAGAAVDVATLPVKAASRSVDMLTTSQSEADEKRGRAMRKREECLGREQRRAERERRQADPSRCD